MRLRVWAALGLFAAFLLCGCGGNGARVSGEVTYKGEPVRKGTITFQPADGKGPSAGAAIADGKYSARDVPPGSKIVRIEAVEEVTFPKTSEEQAQLAKKGGVSPKRADLIPAKAEGNNKKMELQAGNQTLDFHLK